MKTCRILINTPSSQGGIGDLYNFKLVPSLTLGCGSWGGNSVSENVGVKPLINIKTVAERRENKLWIRTPEKVYFKKGCLPVALDELGTVMHKKRCFIVTDSFLYKNGYTKKIEDKLDQMGIQHTCFFEVAPDPTLQCARKGVDQMRQFEPATIIALGGGSAMDAAKAMWMFFEHPDVSFFGAKQKFLDIRKRTYKIPYAQKTQFICIPTTSGTGSEVTSFAVITDSETHIKYPLADYALTPDIASVDPALVMSVPASVTADTGMDVLTHAIESYVSNMASDYTDGLAEKASELVVTYLEQAYDDGTNKLAREKMHNASTIAGMAFTNAFLGINHSLAHKLGAEFHIPHGRINAILLPYVIKYNSSKPTKFVSFPKYEYFIADQKYYELAKKLGLKADNVEEGVNSLIEKIKQMNEHLGIPKSIKDAGIDEKEFLAKVDMLADRAFEDQCTTANPRLPLVSELKQIMLDCYYGK